MRLTPKLMDEFVNEIVLPMLGELGNETSQQIGAEVVFLSHCGIYRLDARTSGPSVNPDVEGEIRIVMRDAFHQDSFKFALQSIMHGIAQGTGFSGFSARGNVRFSHESIALKLTGRSNLYNVWAWPEKFEMNDAD